ncbi:MAG: hypothetical protein US86_C0001G0392 [Candidatus Daviesbacteria bacterium GW2011_GWA2_38_24]|uniref:Uncharacterized protein n=1 Tax=Candidatus Daviesbacteria bacterium GW2011_GWA2_38_24 TaxID=1618422 RepID=A0A0G0JWF2_9BACT|nr:MAG: hypothetical protein US86_C0001G0392 [Candidatus Daviesbacteria bacterium GW2011_GWA2_38_24]KKQ78284.1 MAG: hypothetical protein UT01_C0075G0009 [Candidatus Daviesbacteria bacterium GW2011_GWA1_38_7]OGE23401.1 MAG: hypothetical protein A2688_01830 [Candidatus Daviesbacteria bacterium RIFCSPHIGHO2_01_FULL_38_8]
MTERNTALSAFNRRLSLVGTPQVNNQPQRIEILPAIPNTTPVQRKEQSGIFIAQVKVDNPRDIDQVHKTYEALEKAGLPGPSDMIMRSLERMGYQVERPDFQDETQISKPVLQALARTYNSGVEIPELIGMSGSSPEDGMVWIEKEGDAIRANAVIKVQREKLPPINPTSTEFPSQNTGEIQAGQWTTLFDDRKAA